VIAGAGSQVHHESRERPVGVERAERRGKPRDASRRVGRPVEWIEHDDDIPIDGVQAGFLGEGTEAGGIEHRERSGIGDEVGSVLTGSGTGQPPLVEARE
jgi:hypothetical protein